MYAQGQERVDVDDDGRGDGRVRARVRYAGRCGLHRRRREVEREFQKATIAGTSPIAIVGVALRQVSQLHLMRLEVESGTSASSLVRAAAVRYSLSPRSRSSARRCRRGRQRGLAEVIAMLGQTSLDARVQSALSETLVQRAMTMIARSAAQQAGTQLPQASRRPGLTRPSTSFPCDKKVAWMPGTFTGMTQRTTLSSAQSAE